MPNKVHFKFMAVLLLVLGRDSLELRAGATEGKAVHGKCLGSIEWLDTQTLSFESREMHGLWNK